MASGDQYRARANECIEAADRMVDPEHKVSLLELAQRWMRLAVQLDATDDRMGLKGDALSEDQRRH